MKYLKKIFSASKGLHFLFYENMNPRLYILFLVDKYMTINKWNYNRNG